MWVRHEGRPVEVRSVLRYRTDDPDCFGVDAVLGDTNEKRRFNACDELRLALSPEHREREARFILERRVDDA
jgi:hypothetical protein